MNLSVRITRDPIAGEAAPRIGEGCGAQVEFRGVVRGEEGPQSIHGLEYDAYQPMAEQEMERIVRDLAQQFPCEEVAIVHRIGMVPVGETSILVRVAAKHRAEAFGLMTGFLDLLKKDVPIWKVAAMKAGGSL